VLLLVLVIVPVAGVADPGTAVGDRGYNEIAIFTPVNDRSICCVSRPLL
jgi:hypothetical protein